MRTATLAAIAALIFAGPIWAAGAVSTSPRPIPRPSAQTVKVTPVVTTRRANARFDRWIKDFRPRALRQGISAATFDAAFVGVQYNATVIERDRNQSEFTKQIWEYLDSAASDSRVANGRTVFARHRGVLDRIERHYGVDAEVVAAIWGLESAYGTHRGSINTIEALATLASDSRRGKFFEAQLIAALKILESQDTAPRNMTGSWAGAMGHTQFIPTSYLSFAQDFTGDGRRDIWADDPTDALASTANYLARHGWKRGQPWGMEVNLPSNFDYALSGERVKKPVADWNALGIRTADGELVPNHGSASILLPGGSRGAAFVIFSNFQVIERYNPADAYVIGVGHLADRIAGGGPIRSGWPRGERALSFAEKKELQRLLAKHGYSTGKVDGIIGPNTIAAIRAYQAAIGQTPDGFAYASLLTRIRR